LDVVTDGQCDWTDPFSHLPGRMAGVRLAGSARFPGTNCTYRQPIVEAKLRSRGPLVLDQFRCAHEAARVEVKAVLTAEGEQAEPVSLGGYKITLARGRSFGFGGETPAAKPAAELPGAVSLGSRAMPSDTRPFAIVINTAPDEFLFIGSNGDPSFAVDSR